jgi:hypothetical protein
MLHAICTGGRHFVFWLMGRNYTRERVITHLRPDLNGPTNPPAISSKNPITQPWRRMMTVVKLAGWVGWGFYSSSSCLPINVSHHHVDCM